MGAAQSCSFPARTWLSWVGNVHSKPVGAVCMMGEAVMLQVDSTQHPDPKVPQERGSAVCGLRKPSTGF